MQAAAATLCTRDRQLILVAVFLRSFATGMIAVMLGLDLLLLKCTTEQFGIDLSSIRRRNSYRAPDRSIDIPATQRLRAVRGIWKVVPRNTVGAAHASLDAKRLKNGAGSGNRTRVCSLEGCRSTIELHPHFNPKYTINPFLVAPALRLP